MGRTRNIYGLPNWQFEAMRAKYNALPEEQKEKIKQAEINALNNMMKSSINIVGKCEKCGCDLATGAFGGTDHIKTTQTESGMIFSISRQSFCPKERVVE